MLACNPWRIWSFGLENFLPESMTRKISHAVLSVWLALSMGWIALDKLVRDGDEEGHVGAAELFLGDLRAGDWSGFLERLWIGPMGEYPQAFTAIVGLWWWLLGGGQPSHVAVRSITLASLVIAAISTGRMARRYAREDARDLAEVATIISVLALPLCNGLVRHFMPEGALIAAVSVTLLLAHRLVERPGLLRALLLGFALGFGALTKQTYVLLVMMPLLLVLKRLGRTGMLWGIIAVAVSSMVAVPWMLQNGSDQVSYGLSSILGHGDGGVWEHLVFYPRSLLVLGLGPVLSLLLIFSLFRFRSIRDRRALWFAVVWVIGGLVILMLIPKKYPRLMAPLLPGVALCIGVALAQIQRPRSVILLGGVLSFAWLFVVSTTSLPLQSVRPAIDPGCPQVWVRPPIQDDLGFARVGEALSKASSGPVLVVGDPAIPCWVQTTHDWSSHLSPWLRRAGNERAVVLNPERAHSVVVDWNSGPGEKVEVPIIGATAHIRDTLEP